MAPLVPSPEELERRRIVDINAETVTNIPSTDFPGHWPGESHEWSLAKFRDGFHVEFHQNKQFESSFSLIGLDASIANAFRRIVMAEVPTLAIETVYVHNNTSVIQDEVLAQRLGLIPLKGSVEGLNWMRWFKKAPEGEDPSQNSSPSDFNTVVLHLDIECTKNPNADRDEQDPRKLYKDAHVYAKDIVFHPVGRQEQFFVDEGAIQPVNPDILVAKLRPGQKIDLEMHCVKGIGADHAKFSPVATATYRLMPDIKILRPIIGEDAKKFAKCFPKGVIALEPITAEDERQNTEYKGHRGEDKAIVRDAFNDTVSRECLRHEEFQGKVKLGRLRDHFIYNIESTGQFDSDVLFLESVKVLKLKCSRWKRGLADLMR
ncbi:DNA-directed RNA polymerase [Aspergillus crustosus]